MEHGSAERDGDMVCEDVLAPEILDIRPFCIEAYSPKVEVVVRLLVGDFRPAPSRLFVLHSGHVLHEVCLFGEEHEVTITVGDCPPGVINVVVIAETSALPVTDGDETVAADNIEGESGHCEQSRVHISSVGPLPVLPRKSAEEMMEIFYSNVESAMALSVPRNDDDDNHSFLLREGHIFTDAQKSGIEEMLWRDHFRPFADDLDFLLNNVTPRDLNKKSLKNVEESQVFETKEMKKLFDNMVNFFIDCNAFHTMSFALTVCQAKGFHFGVDLSRDGLQSLKGGVSHQQNESECERRLYMKHYSSSEFLDEDQTETEIPETREATFPDSRKDVYPGSREAIFPDSWEAPLPDSRGPMFADLREPVYPDSLLTESSVEDFPAVAKGESINDLDDFVSAPTGPRDDFMSMPGESPGLVLQGLSQGTASMEALGPASDELPGMMLEFADQGLGTPYDAYVNEFARRTFAHANSEPSSCRKDGKSVGGGELPPPLIAPSFAEALLSTENTSLSMAVATMLVTCWLYLVWGEWGIVLRTIAGVVSLAVGIFWMRGVRFKYRSHVVWISRICLIVMLVGNGAGWFRCPCICNKSREEECIGGVLQSLFWLFTSSSGHQMRIARQVGLLAVEALAFFYSMSKQTPGCNKISIIGLVLFGEVISLMMSLSEFSHAMEGEASEKPQNMFVGSALKGPSACCSSQSNRFDGVSQKSKSE